MNVAAQSGFPVHAAAVKSTFAGGVISPNDVARSGHAGPQLEPAHLNRPPTFAEVAHRILLAKPVASKPGKAKTAQPKAADSQPAVKVNEPAANAGTAAANSFATLSTGLVVVPLAAAQPNTLPQALAIAPDAASQVSTGLASAQPVSFPVLSTDSVPERGLRALATTVADTAKFLAARLPQVAITPGLSPALPARADRGPSQSAVDPIFGTASGEALKLSAESSANLRPGETGKAVTASLASPAVPAESSLQPFHFAGTDAAQAAPASDSRRNNSSLALSPQLAAALQTATVWETSGTTPAAPKTLGADLLTANLSNPHLAGVGPLNPEPQPRGVPDVQLVNLSPSANVASTEPAALSIPVLAALPGLPSAPELAPHTAVIGTRSATVQTPGLFGGDRRSANADTPRSGGTNTSDSLQSAAPAKTIAATPLSAISARGHAAHDGSRAGDSGSANLSPNLSGEPSKGDLSPADSSKAVLGNPLSQESAPAAGASAQTQTHAVPANAKSAASLGSPLGATAIKSVNDKRNTTGRADASRVPAAQDISTTALAGTREASLPQDLGTAADTTNPIALPDPGATHKNLSDPAALPSQPDTRNVQGVLDSAPLAPVQGESAAQGIRAGTLGNVLGAKNSGMSELRLNWKTDAFGRIDLHTIVSDNRVGVTLHSERGELRGVLGAESARFDANLQRHDLHLRELLFTGRETAPSMNFSGGQNQAEARHGPPDRPAAGSKPPPGNARNQTTEPGRTALTMQGGGLSVHV